MKNDSFHIRNEVCPRCRELGNDKAGDNLGVFSDGHCHCWSCGYYVKADGVASFLSKSQENQKPKEAPKVFLPEDCDTNYPQRALDWCRAYEIQRSDLLNNNCLWSDALERLIFPVYGDSSLIAWQGRDFSLNKEENRAKWFGRGNLKDTYNLLGKGDRLVLTEDILSSIKVSKCGVQSMPLYGSFVGMERFKRLYKLFGTTVEVVVWLDWDKAKEAMAEARRGALIGLRTKTIVTELDPKEIPFEELKKVLDNI